MATIQVRDIPDETYAQFRRQARAAGQSLQAYMLEQLVELARTRARKAEMLAEMRVLTRSDRGSGIRIEDVLADLDADRGR